MDRFDRFTDRARKVLTLAQDEAQRFNHNYIGTEHLLLGLVREGEGVAARVLDGQGVELAKVRSAVEFIIGRGDARVVGEVGLTPRAKRVIELAIEEARRLGHNYIGTEHLLLGLVREGEGIAAGVLASLGVTLEATRRAVIVTLSQMGTVDPSIAARATVGARPYIRFEDWTSEARAALVDAQAIAERRSASEIEAVHLLLGLVAAPTASAVTTLALLGVSRTRIQQAAADDAAPETRPGTPRGDDMTSERDEVLALAENEAATSGAAVVSAGHLLVALASRPGSSAGRILSGLGVTADRLRQELGLGVAGSEASDQSGEPTADLSDAGDEGGASPEPPD